MNKRFSTAFFLILFGCGPDLPRDFERLPAAEQIKAYGSYCKGHVHGDALIRETISLHGKEAADIAAQLMDSRVSNLSKVEAFRIISLVQLRGCDLKETFAQHAVDISLRSGKLDSIEQQFATNAATVIENGTRWPPEAFAVRGAPCG